MSVNQQPIDRRKFVATIAAGAAATLSAPAIVTASKTDSAIVLGNGNHRYEPIHDWPQLPSQYTWQTTHDVAIDRDGFVYVIHEGKPELPDHPAIFVFDSDGRYVRSFGREFQGGGHGLEVREEAGEQYLYVCGYQPKVFAKLTLAGEVVWQGRAPMASHLYADGEDTESLARNTRVNFMPTNFAFLNDGGFFLADGYGSFFIHHYDKDAKWLRCFGGPGNVDGKFNTPHGLWIDNRQGRDASLVVTDRANGKLQWFSPEGTHQRTLGGFIMPANIDFYGDTMLVPDLAARVTLLDRDNNVIVHLGDDADWRAEVMKMEIRKLPGRWPAGKFIHPHDACFDHDGNIFVAEFVEPGRITKLRRLS